MISGKFLAFVVRLLRRFSRFVLGQVTRSCLGKRSCVLQKRDKSLKQPYYCEVQSVERLGIVAHNFLALTQGSIFQAQPSRACVRPSSGVKSSSSKDVLHSAYINEVTCTHRRSQASRSIPLKQVSHRLGNYPIPRHQL